MFQRFFRSPIQEYPILTYQWLDDERIYHPLIADVAYIKSFLERTQNDVLITRREYSDLLIGNLKETSTNQEVIIHLISIMKHLIEISIIQFESAILPSLDVLKDFERSDDLQRSVCAMTNHDYYGALICLSDYLNHHRKDDDPLDVMEIHILYIFVNCILSNTL
ncbi:hypothetical protein R6U76_10190 [Lysinibacillus capsici]|uniref:hypothetical protein n=1 Tax=Lysinibacillus capsici TaxID=2115968 RepID=UPI0029DE7D29|nr:hypothetical protein [Lysinibacillus capsici]UNT53669.1 hypothetical protein ICJ70_14075 [Lysinibacillus capsici]WPK07420.1 hypothetical protein R6U76_10190 [Lysinibacillus capsici]